MILGFSTAADAANAVPILDKVKMFRYIFNHSSVANRDKTNPPLRASTCDTAPKK
jgi:hypothetical protein